MIQTLLPGLFTLGSKIQVHFNLEEMKQLCFSLGVDHEGIPGDTRQEKAREIVLYFHRRGEIPRLLEQVKKKRTNVNFTEEFTISAITHDLPIERQRELHFLLEQLQTIYDELIEWKEVHNKLDRLSNQVYGLYVDEVNNHYGKVLNSEVRKQLLNPWGRVDIEIQTFLLWVVETKYIGRTNSDRSSESEQWIRNIEMSYKDVLDCLSRGLANVALQKNRPLLSIFHKDVNPKWRYWWLELDDLTRKLGSELKTQLSRADDKLLQTANELGKQSKKFMGIRGYE